MNAERRNDVGSKILVAVVSALVGVIMTITWFTARDACASSQTNALSIRGLQAGQEYILKTLDEIKANVSKLVERQ